MLLISAPDCYSLEASRYGNNIPLARWADLVPFVQVKYYNIPSDHPVIGIME